MNSIDNFGDLVDYWVTFNEPIATYVGHAKGFFAPGLRDEKYARQCIHHLLLCHGEAVSVSGSSCPARSAWWWTCGSTIRPDRTMPKTPLAP